MSKIDVVEREQGLHRELSQRQLTMIALGSAIGTGLFFGSGFAVSLAGPGVILSYVIAAICALIMMGCLSEMAVAHPTAGSFGAYAEMYIGPFAGWSVRYTYWACQVIAIGGEVVAAAIYMQYWFPDVPSWVWMVAFSAAMVYINARSVANFGAFEYWFALIKVTAIVFFIITGAAVLFGIGTEPIGFSNLTKHDGFLPLGLKGVWMGVMMAIFSFIGVEVVAVTSGEAREPEKAVPRAMRTMVIRLILFYLLSLVIMLCVVPWVEAGGKVSPFVKVFSAIGIPYAAGIMNFVVLTAALSSMNANLYLTSRMMFSLARGQYAPSFLGKLSKAGTPVNALLASTGGIALAVLLQTLGDEQAYLYTFGIALFGALFVWAMVIVTFFFFRAAREREGGKPLPTRMPLHPVLPGIGLALLVAIMITFYFHDFFRVGLYSGAGWLALMFISYCLFGRSAVKNEKAVIGN
ncbi:L-asparagine transporter [Desulforamulus putei DSM 12395]|uniref:L-asparagine transporter n=1 Tax=Desulforamulus putei DSM 12395 TaxID=1121429 RepID=A0A1M4VVI3_9FIRM|nr:amino acid permease [Desulforamulus putei]SHE73021.1 L-asparagine transporter [Desulforamulus putei DSM 12395]